ncbi:hypothetical protein EIH07_08530 [Chryseobacterium taklimakanense]|uniref:DUF6252 family protein n=1 Tax=Chryseobacterium taklimakanense TaxID=536441 RepID=UPI000F5FCAF9|nr:DUF6252 family protein [Chryseobacterium taklimakanense]AZI23074.1 hypothetical protein EIH07_08530 [Chryseobacterium taklimakanense]
MRSVILYLAFGLFFCLSCRDEGSGSDGYFIMMKVNGNLKKGDISKTQSFLTDYQAVVGDTPKNLTQLLVVSNNLNGKNFEMLSFSLNEFTGVGTYSLAEDDPWVTAQYGEDVNNSSKIYPKHSGQMIITEFKDNKVRGTFEFVGKNYETGQSVSITNGEFYLEAQKNVL